MHLLVIAVRQHWSIHMVPLTVLYTERLCCRQGCNLLLFSIPGWHYLIGADTHQTIRTTRFFCAQLRQGNTNRHPVCPFGLWRCPGYVLSLKLRGTTMDKLFFRPGSLCAGFCSYGPNISFSNTSFCQSFKYIIFNARQNKDRATVFQTPKLLKALFRWRSL